MKRIITTLIILFFTIQVKAQETGNYIFTKAFQTEKIVNFKGDSISAQTVIHKPGRKFSIVNQTEKYYIIQYWSWNEVIKKTIKKDNKRGILNTTIEKNFEAVNLNNIYFKMPESYGKDGKIDSSKPITLKYFRIKKEDLPKVATKYYNRWLPVTAGIYYIPFKIRLKEFEFEQDLNVGVSLGFPMRLFRTSEEKWIIEPNVGIGITKINLNTKNTDSIVTSERTANALTLSSGVLLRFSEKINMGVFGGWDFLSKADRDTNWIYDRKFWLGVGINISFNMSGENREEEGENEG